jgi:hypothetical protein
VLERFEHTFPREAVQAPEQHTVKLAAAGSVEHRLELDAIAALAGCPIGVLPHDRPVLPLAELPQLLKLVLGVLPAIFRAHSAVQRNPLHCVFVCHALTMRPA